MYAMFINTNQMMAIVEHFLKHTFNLNRSIQLVKSLKWSQGKKDSMGTIGNKKETHKKQ
jgi:hypothetical protein